MLHTHLPSPAPVHVNARREAKISRVDVRREANVSIVDHMEISSDSEETPVP